MTYNKNYASLRVSTKTHSFAPRYIMPMTAWEISKPDNSAAVDLSAGGNANCYLVPPAAESGRYSFEVKHVDGTPVEGEAYLAECLWETSAGLVGNVSFDREVSKIYFDVKGGNVSGNALISLLDYSRKVIWSWHIWVTDVKDQTWGTVPYTFLDRNLGAVWSPASASEADSMTDAQAISSMGLQYQWGRNVPMPGAGKITGWDHEVTTVSGNLNKDGNPIPNGTFGKHTPTFVFHKYYPDYQGWELRNMDITMAEMAEFPLSFNKIWKVGDIQYFTSWASDCVATGEDAGWRVNKTNTDPCPPGYRVPNLDEIKNFANDGLSDITLTHVNLSGSDSYGGYFVAEEQVVWAPKAGFRTSGYNTVNGNGYTSSMTRVGKDGMCMFWTFNPDDTKDVLKQLTPQHTLGVNSRADGNVYQRFFYMEGSGNFKAGSSDAKIHALSSGSSVRCVKIK